MNPDEYVDRLIERREHGALVITLTGTHFVPHAELIIDGRPGGTVSQSTSQQVCHT